MRLLALTCLMLASVAFGQQSVSISRGQFSASLLETCWSSDGTTTSTGCAATVAGKLSISVASGSIGLQGVTGQKWCVDTGSASCITGTVNSIVLSTAVNLGSTIGAGSLAAYVGNGRHLGLNSTSDTTYIASDATGSGSVVVGVGNVLSLQIGPGTASRGTKILSGGTGTVTVLSGAICVCNNNTSLLACQSNVSSTTLTITSGVGTDTTSYLCY